MRNEPLKRAQAKYLAKFDRIVIRLLPVEKVRIKNFLEKTGYSYLEVFKDGLKTKGFEFPMDEVPKKINTKFHFAAKDQDWFAKLSPSQAEGRKGLVRQKAYAAVKEKKIVKIIYVPHIDLDRKKVLSKTNFRRWCPSAEKVYKSLMQDLIEKQEALILKALKRHGVIYKGQAAPLGILFEGVLVKE